MGKRELLLAAVFVAVGFLVYQFTAPPADPSQQGFSFSKIVDELRREVRGQREAAEGTETTRHPLAASVQEIRIGIQSGPLTITGEERDDIEAELHVRSSGFDKAEAERLVKATRVTIDEAGALLILDVSFPREGRQTASLKLRVPARLGVRMDSKHGVLKVTNVASVAIASSRAEAAISDVPGAVTVTQRGQTITIDKVGSLRLATLAGAEARVSNVSGDASFNLQSGELRASHLAGTLEVEARNADIRLEQLEKVRGPVRINAVSGELMVTGLRTEARIDGRETEVRIEHAGAAPLVVYNEGNEPIELTLSKEGVKLDALAVNGRITLDSSLEKQGLTVSEGERGQGSNRTEVRLSGSVHGGGPPITLRASRGDILLKTK